ncbi:predicted protein [Naegleria gruberi]|uniref:Predicted protein n=1 Tax=Naegleria gruberi TaxID=5762 RepID=D2V247_NAEGR|nr:uncharacterized protein NAEGRDRAFT_62876 [Naegleria gruberi]EFC48841.1 predicted protein [Naegleria gruberi]|eukprot:XP_002681585.1 predicted protein [Naegleria gruberi strain NEG-M]
MQTLPIEILTEHIFTLIIDFNDQKFGEQISNLCLVCSEWANCFYNISSSSSAENGELFWRVKLDSLNNNNLNNNNLNNHDDDDNLKLLKNKRDFNFRELFILQTIPILDFPSNERVSFTGPVGTDQLFYSGNFQSCRILNENSQGLLALHKRIMTNCLQILHDGKGKHLSDSSYSLTFLRNCKINAFSLVGQIVDWRSEFEFEYGRIYNERVAKPYSEFIVNWDVRAVPGDFIVSTTGDLIERLKNAVQCVETRNEKVDEYYYFVMRKALYETLLNRNVQLVKINDMTRLDDEEDEYEMNAPQEQFQIPFPKNFDELESFLQDNSVLILSNPLCITYPCSCDVFTFMIFSKVQKGHAIFLNIESTS